MGECLFIDINIFGTRETWLLIFLYERNGKASKVMKTKALLVRIQAHDLMFKIHAVQEK
jgi:hypothetical protein